MPGLNVRARHKQPMNQLSLSFAETEPCPNCGSGLKTDGPWRLCPTCNHAEHRLRGEWVPVCDWITDGMSRPALSRPKRKGQATAIEYRKQGAMRPSRSDSRGPKTYEVNA